MTGPQHYREAERLLRMASGDLPADAVAVTLAHADVHATLALAAETALTAGSDHARGIDVSAWEDIAGASRTP